MTITIPKEVLFVVAFIVTFLFGGCIGIASVQDYYNTKVCNCRLLEDNNER